MARPVQHNHGGIVAILTSQPTHHEIVADLRSRIESGEYRPGDRLPNDGELAERYRASRAAVRRAIDLLRTEGIIQPMHGIGCFVTTPPAIREVAMAELDKVCSGLDTGEGTQRGSTTHIRFVAADNAEALRFGVALRTELTVRETVIREEGVPMMLAVSTVPRTLTIGTELEQPGPGDGGADLLRALGQPLESKETIQARTPTERERSVLDLADYRPLLVVNRVTYTRRAPARMLEVREVVLRADRFRLS